MSDNPTKLCIDCKHCAPRLGMPDLYLCKEPRVTTVNIINGERIYKYCGTMRSVEFGCGKEGRWWEEKRGILSTIISRTIQKIKEIFST